MNPATAWAVENSAATGAERAVLIAISRRAIGCVAVCDSGSVMHEVRMKRSAYYACLVPLEQLREIQRITQPSDNARLRTFHLPRFCQSRHEVCNLTAETASATVNCGNPASFVPAIDRTESTDLNIKKQAESSGNYVQNLLFAESLTKDEAREMCEDCRGTGWRTTEAGAILCAHSTARIAGRWSIADSFAEERFLNAHIGDLIGPKPAQPLAVQLRLKASA